MTGNPSDIKMKLASQIAYLDGEEGKTVRELVDRTIANLKDQDNLSSKQKSQLEAAVEIDKMLKDENYNLQECGNWIIKDVEDLNSETGFYGCMIDTGDGEAVLTFRGSEGLGNFELNQLILDWGIADLGMLTASETYQQQIAALYTQRIWQEYGFEYESFNFAGHSLGGNLAEHARLTAPDEMVTGRTVSFDGPGYSDEYIGAHKEEIQKNASEVDHYQYSAVGDMLNQIPGAHNKTIEAGGEGIERHDLNNVTNFDANGNVISGEQDSLARKLGPLSRILDGIPSGMWSAWQAQLMYIMASMGLGIIVGMIMLEEKKVSLATENLQVLQGIKENLEKWFSGMSGAALTGAYETNISVVNAVGEDMDGIFKKLDRIYSDADDIVNGLKYNSLAGTFFKSRLKTLNNKVERDKQKVSALAEVIRDCAQYSREDDERVAQIYERI